MRILLALDGSASSDRARDLVAGMTFPVGSTIKVVTVVPQLSKILGAPWMPIAPDNADEIERSAVCDGDRILATASNQLQHPGRAIETQLLRGSAAAEIVRAVERWDPDLVVVGNRGHGPFQTLLGSVSAAVVDHVSCPVLVARTATIGRIALAHDGSPFAANAARILAQWPIFGAVEIDVLTAMDSPGTWADGSAPIIAAYSREAWEHTVHDARQRHEEIATAAAGELRKAGRTAVAVVLQGHPAAAIVDYARRAGVDLIAVGTHGRTGISRLVLGSVARSVLLHTPSSVLVVRPEPAARRVRGRGVAVEATEVRARRAPAAAGV